MRVIAAGTAPEGSAILLPATYDLIWGGLSFLIVIVLFWKFVLPRLKEVMEDRTDRIEGGIARAEEMQQQARMDLDSYKLALAEAREEAAAIRTQAQADRAAIVEEARNEARIAAATVTAAAEAQIVAERNQATTALTRQVGELAVGLAGKVVGQSLEDDARVRATVDAFISDLEQQAAR
jgi:F-type H+-transporting ATPase subunit b